ncbi:hypothetical protein [Thiobacillus thioparus]|jgi:hypothetical protein|uniref:hypothetical protein n=1 Tax=Thiobacillus thioparus TaxID=931 RepID=UPI000363B462|nr:hypothetical protein [Thiobacillus thioparus]
MKIKHVIFGERSLTKVAGLFMNRSGAEDAAQQVKRTAGLDDAQVNLVGPPDGDAPGSPAFSSKLEPEQAGIWRTLVRAHVASGTAGIAVGVLLYLGFIVAGNPAVMSTPGMSLMAFVFFGGLLGLLVGGLLTVRPDHLLVITSVRRAIRKGRWAVVIHPVTQAQIDRAVNELRGRGYRVVRSL